MSDEGVHEIQLNGKQLVFMFMAVTVVAVVIFLCGVMVGRGVRAPRATEQANAIIESTIDPTAAVQPPAAPASDAPSPVGPGSSQEKLTYADRLSTTTPPPETLKDPVATERAAPEVKVVAEVNSVSAVKAPPPVAPAVRASKPAPSERAASNVKTVPGVKPAASDSAGGYVVQVAAVKVRSEADTIAKRLASKGFPSFVTSPSGDARVYRVRVGTYGDRREAESVARRLEKEEQFKPWITR
jgi:cell division protein FtsN